MAAVRIDPLERKRKRKSNPKTHESDSSQIKDAE